MTVSLYQICQRSPSESIWCFQTAQTESDLTSTECGRLAFHHFTVTQFNFNPRLLAIRAAQAIVLNFYWGKWIPLFQIWPSVRWIEGVTKSILLQSSPLLSPVFVTYRAQLETRFLLDKLMPKNQLLHKEMRIWHHLGVQCVIIEFELQVVFLLTMTGRLKKKENKDMQILKHKTPFMQVCSEKVSSCCNGGFGAGQSGLNFLHEFEKIKKNCLGLKVKTLLANSWILEMGKDKKSFSQSNNKCRSVTVRRNIFIELKYSLAHLSCWFSQWWTLKTRR